MKLLHSAVQTPTLPAVVRRWAAERPAAVFCTIVRSESEERISFAQLEARSRCYARAYRAAGVGAGDVVTIVLAHSAHELYSFIGALRIGAIPSFLAPPSPKQSAERYWRDHTALEQRIGAALCVTSETNRDAPGAAEPARVLLAGDSLLDAFADPGEPFDEPALDTDAIACLQHSSGTTSAKKGVMLSHRAILDHVAAYSGSLRVTRDDSVASWLPLYHDMGFVACFLLSLVNGTHLVKLDPFEWVARPGLLFDAIERHRTTLTWLPNFAFAHLVNATPATRAWDLSSVRAFVDCSEPCRPQTLARFVERFAASGVTANATGVCYAMAENVFAVTQTPIGAPPSELRLDRTAFAAGRIVSSAAPGALRVISCGKPVPGVRIAIDAVDAASSPGELRAGEILIDSPFLFDGYYRLPERTGRAFRDGWYATGDVGYVANGELYVSGRLDDMLIVNGRNYYAHEIEAIVGRVAGVKPGRAVAIALHAIEADAAAIAILLECAADIDLAALKRTVKNCILDDLALGVHSVTVVPPGSLIKTTSGKLDRRRNTELFFTYAANPGGLQ